MSTNSNCRFSGCKEPATVTLEAACLCVPHFISTGYERLDEYTRAMSEHRLQESSAEAIFQFLVECIERAADLTQHAQQLDNLSRARLLDILLLSAELSRQLRRSARREAAIPICLRCEKLGRAWQEETQTKVLSRYGALVECTRGPERGDTLTLVRLDTGEQTQARVAWRREASGGRFEVGVEFVNCDNFWGLNWGAMEEVSHLGDWNFHTRQ